VSASRHRSGQRARRGIVRHQRGAPRDTSEVVETLIAFVAVSAVVICTPGPDTALTIRNTLAAGRRGGIATAIGVSIGQAIWTVAASAGVVALLSASEPAFRALKLAGAAYLVYLGGQSLHAAFVRRGHDPTSRHRSVAKSSGAAAARELRQGVISNLGNPKMAVFFASLLPQFAPGGSASFLALLALGLLFCSMTLAWLTLYAIAVARVRQLLAGPVRRAIDAVTGIVLVLFGIRLAAEGR
jgi:threonine/homoserine/homoserine lactone efflux protein